MGDAGSATPTLLLYRHKSYANKALPVVALPLCERRFDADRAPANARRSDTPRARVILIREAAEALNLAGQRHHCDYRSGIRRPRLSTRGRPFAVSMSGVLRCIGDYDRCRKRQCTNCVRWGTPTALSGTRQPASAKSPDARNPFQNESFQPRQLSSAETGSTNDNLDSLWRVVVLITFVSQLEDSFDRTERIGPFQMLAELLGDNSNRTDIVGARTSHPLRT